MRTVLFEPWGLGDAVIAASIVRERPEEFILACDPKWEAIFKATFKNDARITIYPLALEYTSRSRKNRIKSGKQTSKNFNANEVLSIRGDFRDWLAARKIFPGIKQRTSGWTEFFIRRIPLLDIPFRMGAKKVRNRYRAWAELTNTPYEAIERSYKSLQCTPGKDGKATIHIGAQWKSRQFPEVELLRNSLNKNGFEVELIAGPNDPLPKGIQESEVYRTNATELVEKLSLASWVIANDSGPMHLAALLGAKTLVIARISNITEWLPPMTEEVHSAMPTGYAPDSRYSTDEVVMGWPSVDEIISRFKKMTS